MSLAFYPFFPSWVYDHVSSFLFSFCSNWFSFSISPSGNVKMVRYTTRQYGRTETAKQKGVNEKGYDHVKRLKKWKHRNKEGYRRTPRCSQWVSGAGDAKGKKACKKLKKEINAHNKANLKKRNAAKKKG